jgi:hypothetical protein
MSLIPFTPFSENTAIRRTWKRRQRKPSSPKPSYSAATGPANSCDGFADCLRVDYEHPQKIICSAEQKGVLLDRKAAWLSPKSTRFGAQTRLLCSRSGLLSAQFELRSRIVYVLFWISHVLSTKAGLQSGFIVL